jgi:hypothetical protein
MHTPVNFSMAQFDDYRPREPAKTLILKSVAKSPPNKYSSIKHVRSVHQLPTNGAKGGS